MNWKPTWLLLGLAAGLFAFIVLIERRLSDQSAPPARLLSFRATEVTNIQLRLTNQLLLRVERTNAAAPWQITVPLVYPAQPHAIEWLIQSLEAITSQTDISAAELKSSHRTAAEFGLDIPRATLTLQHAGQRTEILFGARTPVGEGVYVQVLDQPDIHVLPAELAERLPRSHNDWRDTTLMSITSFNRMEVRSAGRGFTVDINQTNRTLVLTKPTPARADIAKVDALWRKLFTTQVTQFITDNPRVDLEPYGLLPPEAEVSFLVGAGDQYAVQSSVQFGKSPTNDPGSVYARRVNTTNIVLVPRATLDALQISHGDVRDLHLLTFAPKAVDIIEVVATNQLASFTLRRQTNGAWMITEPEPALADSNSVREWIDQLAKLEGEVEKDVVTDFSTPYQLATPFRKYILKFSGTNGTGNISNHVVAELDLGRVMGEKVFARRPDEATAYSLARADVARLPHSAWQLRDRQVWNFTTNQIHRVTVQYNRETRTLQRNVNATWSLVQGEGMINSVNPVLEEIMYRLGDLRAEIWVSKGDESRAALGFTTDGNRITFELKNGEKPKTLVLEFGRPGVSPTKLPYALAVVDGQTWIFEFPPKLHFEVVRDLFSPLFRGAQ